MPLIDRTERFQIALIDIDRDRRQRREIKTDGLRESMKNIGLIQAIVVERAEGGRAKLMAGERRLTAAKELGWTDILVRWSEDLTEAERQLIELEENVKRQDLPWQDLVRSVAGLHRIYTSLDSDWTMTRTAEACALSLGIVSMYLTVHEDLTDENVLQSGTVREAYNLLLRRKKRAMGDQLQELLDASSPEALEEAKVIRESVAGIETTLERNEAQGIIEAQSSYPILTVGAIPEAQRPIQPALPGFDLEPILPADFLTWIGTYDGRKFNLLHCDFPYGVNLFSSNGLRTGPNRSQMGRDEGESYDDDPELYKRLVTALGENLDRIFSVSGHIMFWLDARFDTEAWTRAEFARLAPSISWTRFPLIWLKSDNVGLASSPNYEPRHVYEKCLLGSRGKRNIVRVKADAYSAPTDKSLHQSAKPAPMLRHFMEMLVDENTSLFDPTCGSGTALRAAESLGAKRILGLERDERMAGLALKALKAERAKGRAAAMAPIDF